MSLKISFAALVSFIYTQIALAGPFDNIYPFAIAYGNGQFVAVGYPGLILTSSDGVTWTARQSGTKSALTGITFAAGKFVIVGKGGAILTSSDAVDWTWYPVQTAAYNYANAIGYGGGQFVAVGDGVITSIDGINWVERSWWGLGWGNGVAYGNGMFVAVGLSPRIQTSVDGMNWAQYQWDALKEFDGVAYGNGVFVAVGEEGIQTSVDGVNWVQRRTGVSSHISFANNLFVATSDETVVTSSDGVDWSENPSLGNSIVAYGNGRMVSLADIHNVRAERDSCSAPSFVSAHVIPVGDSPILSDFNGDGRLDLAVVSSNPTNTGVLVLLANKDGSFQSAATYAAGVEPRLLALGNFNDDASTDLIVGNQGSSSDGRTFTNASFSVLLGNRDGTFGGAVNYNLDDTPLSLAVADVNRDGKADLVVTTRSGVKLFLSKGDGTFVVGTSFSTPTGWAPAAVLADLNLDGKIDLAIAFGSGVSIRIGNGDGTFQAEKILNIPTEVLVAGDFNNDGIIDLAALSVGDEADFVGKLTLLLGMGDGNFNAITNLGLPYPISATVGDINGDGNLDLIVGASAGSSSLLSLMLGNGDGTFRPVALNISATSAAVGYLNEDTKMDLVTSDGSVLLNNGPIAPTQPTFALMGEFSVNGFGGTTAVGDFNGDGKPDVVIGDDEDSGLASVLLGKGDGLFEPAAKYPSGSGAGVVSVGDFNHDGKLDIVAADHGSYDQGSLTYTNSGISFLRGNGDGTFQTAVHSDAGLAPNSLAVGDFNGDSKLDLALTDNSALSVLLGNGDGTFRQAFHYSMGGSAGKLIVADSNGDGKPDIVVANLDNDSTNGIGFSILLGNGDGTFQNAVAYNTGYGVSSLAAADLDHDGKLDLVVGNMPTSDPATGSLTENGLSLLLRTSDGGFRPPVKYATSSVLATSISIGDLNNDGNLDLIVSGNGTSILLGNGNGTFQPVMRYPGYRRIDSVAVADFNQDGKLDWITSWSEESAGARASIWLNTSCSPSPTLAIAIGSDELKVSWPSSPAGFLLEYCTDLSSSNWKPLETPPLNIDGRWQSTVSLASGQHFFRLRRP